MQTGSKSTPLNQQENKGFMPFFLECICVVRYMHINIYTAKEISEIMFWGLPEHNLSYQDFVCIWRNKSLCLVLFKGYRISTLTSRIIRILASFILGIRYLDETIILYLRVLLGFSFCMWVYLRTRKGIVSVLDPSCYFNFKSFNTLLTLN